MGFDQSKHLVVERLDLTDNGQIATNATFARSVTVEGNLRVDGNADVEGIALDIDTIQFDTTQSVGTTQVGELAWNDTTGTLELLLGGGNVKAELSQNNLIYVKNQTGSAINKGDVVYASGSTGVNILVSKSSNTSEPSSSRTLAMAAESIANGSHGYITTFGVITGLDTEHLVEGQAVYLGSTAGTTTSTKPTSPNHLVIVGFCLRSQQNTGTIFVNIQNGFELEELHDVLISTPTDGQSLVYESASGLWKNTNTVGTEAEVTAVIESSSINSFSDVNLTSPTNGQILIYNSSTGKWENGDNTARLG